MRTSASGLLLPEPLECAKQSIHLILAQIHQDVKQKTSWYFKKDQCQKTSYIKHFAVSGRADIFMIKLEGSTNKREN